MGRQVLNFWISTDAYFSIHAYFQDVILITMNDI